MKTKDPRSRARSYCSRGSRSFRLFLISFVVVDTSCTGCGHTGMFRKVLQCTALLLETVMSQTYVCPTSQFTIARQTLPSNYTKNNYRIMFMRYLNLAILATTVLSQSAPAGSRHRQAGTSSACYRFSHHA
jgi:hypothetical protein